MSASEKRPRTPTAPIDLTSSPLQSPAHKRSKAPTTQTTTTTAALITQTISNDQLYHTILSLPNEKKSKLLFDLAKQDPSIVAQITSAADTTPAATFSNEIDRVDMCILEGEGGLNPTEEDIPLPQEELPDVLSDILKKASRGTRYETRRNAVFAIGQCIDYMVNPHADLQLETEEVLEWVDEYAEGVHQILAYCTKDERVKLRSEEDWSGFANTATSVNAEELLRVVKGFVEFVGSFSSG